MFIEDLSKMNLFVTDDLRIDAIDPLISPAILIYEYPVSDKASETVSKARRASEAIFSGEDDRLLVLVGPCSIHDPQAAIEYAQLLKKEMERLQDDLCIIMRVYYEKPRTTVGWKGLINDPNLDNTYAINKGLKVARELLISLNEAGVPAGSEFLDTITPQYIADLVSWGAIGARTTESQVHRELASGLSMPVGFKNGTGGCTQIAIDAIVSASKPHHFLSVTKQGVAAIVSTSGNDTCHIILRGSNQGPNYDAQSVEEVHGKLVKAGVVSKVMIDCSHGNSRKDYRNQPGVADDIAGQIANGSTSIGGVMIESNLKEGAQSFTSTTCKEDLEYGKSITDQCIGWEDTVKILDTLAESVRTRRMRKS